MQTDQLSFFTIKSIRIHPSIPWMIPSISISTSISISIHAVIHSNIHAFITTLIHPRHRLHHLALLLVQCIVMIRPVRRGVLTTYFQLVLCCDTVHRKRKNQRVRLLLRPFRMNQEVLVGITPESTNTQHLFRPDMPKRLLLQIHRKRNESCHVMSAMIHDGDNMNMTLKSFGKGCVYSLFATRYSQFSIYSQFVILYSQSHSSNNTFPSPKFSTPSTSSSLLWINANLQPPTSNL